MLSHTCCSACCIVARSLASRSSSSCTTKTSQTSINTCSYAQATVRLIQHLWRVYSYTQSALCQDSVSYGTTYSVPHNVPQHTSYAVSDWNQTRANIQLDLCALHNTKHHCYPHRIGSVCTCSASSVSCPLVMSDKLCASRSAKIVSNSVGVLKYKMSSALFGRSSVAVSVFVTSSISPWCHTMPLSITLPCGNGVRV